MDIRYNTINITFFYEMTWWIVAPRKALSTSVPPAILGVQSSKSSRKECTCGAGSAVPREAFDSSVIMPFSWCVVAVTLPI